MMKPAVNQSIKLSGDLGVEFRTHLGKVYAATGREIIEPSLNTARPVHVHTYAMP